MSAAGRGADRAAHDHYETPPEAIEPLLPFLPSVGLVVDAGCGSGAIARELANVYGRHSIVGVDCDPQHRAAALRHVCEFVHGDFLSWVNDDSSDRLQAFGDGPRLCVMNPPYSAALDFIRAGLELVGPRGYVIALVRLGFLASRRRRAFWQLHPADVIVLSERPSFCWSWTYRLVCEGCGKEYKLTRSTPIGSRAPDLGAWAGHCEGALPALQRAKSPVTKCTTDATDYCWLLLGPGPRGTWRVA